MQDGEAADRCSIRRCHILPVKVFFIGNTVSSEAFGQIQGAVSPFERGILAVSGTVCGHSYRQCDRHNLVP
jgi:hypothetical protein